MKESIQHLDKNVLFRETFNSQNDTVRNSGAMIGDPTFSNGVISLDGSDAVNIDTVLEKLRTQTTGSISLWVRFADATPISLGHLIAFGDTDGNVKMLFRNTTVGKVRIFVRNATEVKFDVTTDNVVFSDNTWHYVVFVQDGTEVTIYVDGTAAAATFATSTDKTFWFNDFTTLDNGRIGCQNDSSNGNTGFCIGDYDLIEIYDKVLSSTEVTALYNKRLYRPISEANEVLNIDPRLGTIEDSYGNAITNTAVSVVKDGGFYVGEYDGSTSYLSIADDSSLSFGDGSSDSPFSIEVWVKMDDVSAFNLVCKGVGGTDQEYKLFIHTDDKIRFQTADESVSAIIGRKCDTVLTSYEGQWAHLVATYDGTGYNGGSYGHKIYLNDVQIDSSDSAGGVVANYVAMENILNHAVEIGKYDTTYANGKIGRTRIYNKELSAEEVARQYNSAKHLFHK